MGRPLAGKPRVLFLLPSTVSSWEGGIVQCVFRVLAGYDTPMLCVGARSWTTELPGGSELVDDLPSADRLVAVAAVVFFGGPGMSALLQMLVSRFEAMSRFPHFHAIDFDEPLRGVLTTALNGSVSRWSLSYDTAPRIAGRCTAFAYGLMT